MNAIIWVSPNFFDSYDRLNDTRALPLQKKRKEKKANKNKKEMKSKINKTRIREVKFWKSPPKTGQLVPFNEGLNYIHLTYWLRSWRVNKKVSQVLSSFTLAPHSPAPPSTPFFSIPRLFLSPPIDTYTQRNITDKRDSLK